MSKGFYLCGIQRPGHDECRAHNRTVIAELVMPAIIVCTLARLA